MPRLNYPPRKKTLKHKKTGFEIQQEQINDFLDLLFERKEMKEWDAQRKLGWGPGIHNKNKTILLGYYSDEVGWNKKTKTWKHIPLTLEKPIAEQVTSKPLEENQIE